MNSVKMLGKTKTKTGPLGEGQMPIQLVSSGEWSVKSDTKHPLDESMNRNTGTRLQTDSGRSYESTGSG